MLLSLQILHRQHLILWIWQWRVTMDLPLSGGGRKKQKIMRKSIQAIFLMIITMLAWWVNQRRNCLHVVRIFILSLSVPFWTPGKGTYWGQISSCFSPSCRLCFEWAEWVSMMPSVGIGVSIQQSDPYFTVVHSTGSRPGEVGNQKSDQLFTGNSSRNTCLGTVPLVTSGDCGGSGSSCPYRDPCSHRELSSWIDRWSHGVNRE